MNDNEHDEPAQSAQTQNPKGHDGSDAADTLESAFEGQMPPDADENSVEGLQARINDLVAELSSTQDKMLRALADAENTRRRSAKDREEANIYGGFRLARDLLPVHDNFQRALQNVDDTLRANASDFIEGVELTQRELLSALAKHRIVPVSPEIGEKFDADQHQAMFEAPVPGAENGTIIEVMQDGFMCADRLLRAAMVGVARNAAAPKTEDSQA